MEFIPEDRYVGIGTGSIIDISVEALGRSGKQIKGAVFTPVKSSEPLAKYDIPEASLSDVSGLVVYVNGADEVSHMLRMIGGGDGAHLNERIVASASDKFVCIADESKYVSRLGGFPLPVEVIPHACPLISHKLVMTGGEPKLRVGFTTFSDNQTVDVHGLHTDRPVSTGDEINRITGVVEDGILDHNIADVLILGTGQGAKVILSGQN